MPTNVQLALSNLEQTIAVAISCLRCVKIEVRSYVTETTKVIVKRRADIGYVVIKAYSLKKVKRNTHTFYVNRK